MSIFDGMLQRRRQELVLGGLRIKILTLFGTSLAVLLFAEMFAPVLCPALLEVPEPLRKAKALAAGDPVAIMQRMKRKREQDEKAKIEFAIEIEKGHCRARNECFGFP
jgi:hypothetical protein